MITELMRMVMMTLLLLLGVMCKCSSSVKNKNEGGYVYFLPVSISFPPAINIVLYVRVADQNTKRVQFALVCVVIHEMAGEPLL